MDTIESLKSLKLKLDLFFKKTSAAVAAFEKLPKKNRAKIIAILIKLLTCVYFAAITILLSKKVKRVSRTTKTKS
jgi:hypothetical protein